MLLYSQLVRVCALLLAISSFGYAQVPPNDLCVNAIPLTVGATCTYTTGTNVNATGTASPAPGCASYQGNEIWYSVVVPAGGAVNFETESNGGMNDSGLAAYSGTCGSLTLIQCNDDGGVGLFSKLELQGLTPGATIYFCIWDYNGGGQGSVDLCATIPPPPPVNDDCSNATPLTVGVTCTNISGTTQSATNSPGVPAPGCANYQGSDVWYTLTVPANGSFQVQTTSGVIFDGGMAIYSGTCSALSLIECDDFDGPGSMPSIALSGQTPGDVLYVRFWEDGNNNNGSFEICVIEANVPVNDDCANATPLTVGATCSNISGSTLLATDTPGVPAPGCANYQGGDVWYTVTVPASGNLQVQTTAGNTLTDGGMAIYSGTCAALSLIECDDFDGPGAMPSIILSGQTPGDVLYVRFWEDGNNSNGSFEICAIEPTVPVNDDCANATPLTVGATCSNITGSNVLATDTPGVPAPGCANYQGGDVWYTVTVPATGNVQVQTTSGGILTDGGMAIYSGTCAALTLIECDDFDGPGSMPSISLLGQTPGDVLYVRFWEDGNNTFGDFDICAIELPPAPVNDLCANAIPLTVGATCVNTAGTTLSATDTPGVPAPGCANYQGGDVWYTVTVPANGNLQVTTTAGVITDGGMAVYSGICGALSLIECDDFDGPGGMPLINLTGQTPGAVLYVRFWEDGGNNNGSFQICATELPNSPANDLCPNATPLIVGATCINTSGTTISASDTPGVPAPGCANYQGGDVWYTVTVPANGNLQITTTAGGITDGGMAVYSGVCGALSLIECDDLDGPGAMPSISLIGQTPGDVLYVRFWEDGNNVFGSFEICATELPDSPPNDDCINAISLPVNATCVTTNATNAFATNSIGAPAPGCANYQGGDVWFSVVVPAGGNITVESLAGTMTDGGMAIYSGTCGALSLISCEDDNGTGTMPSMTLNGQTPGATLYVRMWESGNNNNGTFEICATIAPPPPPPPSNDDCSGAIPVGINTDGTCTITESGSVTGATASSQSQAGCAGTENDDVWFSFVAPALGALQVDLINVAGSNVDLAHSIWEGTCPALTLVAGSCSDPNTSDITGLTAGTTYYVRVNSFSGSNPTTTFDICLKEIDPCGGFFNNDYCQGPATLTAGAGTFSSSTAALYTPDTPGNMIGPFCGSIENNSWYQFVASNTTEVFDIISVTGCTQGIQALVYEVVTDANGCCTGFTSPSNCYGPGNTTLGVVTATGLTIGNTYIFMVDGFAGANCDFEIANWSAVGILPVELVDFHGITMPDNNVLRWQTVSEINNDYFEIFKSYDLTDFTSIGTVKGVGNSTSPIDYSFVDSDIRTGKTYYRLDQIDIDGTRVQSEIIALDRKANKEGLISASPNPTTGQLLIEINSTASGSNLDILDFKGNVLQSRSVNFKGVSTLTIDLSELTSGMYIIRFTDYSGKQSFKRIVKK